MHLGVYSAAQLRDAGYTYAEIKKRVKSGTLKPIKRGWYRSADANETAIRAVQLGGRIGCLTGCQLHGLWVPEQHRRVPHVILPKNASVPPGKMHVQTHRYPGHTGSVVWPVTDCLQQVLRNHDRETALVVMESAVHNQLISYEEGWGLIANLSESKQRLLKYFSDQAQSGSETRVRLELQRRRVPVKPQQYISGVGWVDLLVGRSWIIECDSKEHHSRADNYENDRRRDLLTEQLGYQTTRLSYRQIWRDWEVTKRILSGRLQTRKHSKPPVAPQ